MPKKSVPAARKIYWDACVFLSIIEGHPDRIPIIEAIVDDCKRGTLEIFTSTLSIAEVAFAKSEKDGAALDIEVERKLNLLWSPSSPFRLIEVHRAIVYEAQSYVRNGMALQIGLKPPDAIHLASAKKSGAAEFHTYDDFNGKRQQVEELTGLKIIEPKADGIVYKQ